VHHATNYQLMPHCAKSVSNKDGVPAEQIQTDAGESVLASNLSKVNGCHCRMMNSKHLMPRACLRYIHVHQKIQSVFH